MPGATPESIRLPKPPWYLRLLSLKVVIPLALAMLLALAPFLNRAWFLSAMPRVEEPFDRAELENLQIPEAENAFTHYRRAENLSVKATAAEEKVRDQALDDGWREGQPDLEIWLQRWQPKLQEYEAGAKLERAMSLPVSEHDWIAGMPSVGELREYGRVAVILADRQQARRDLPGAWERLHELCRVSRHVGQYGEHIERLVGIALFEMFASRLPAWAAEPDLTSADLRRAMQELQAAWQLTAPVSRTTQIKYCSNMNTLRLLESGSAGYSWSEFLEVPEPAGLRLYVQGEPELGKRVLRFYCQNWLRYVDLPPYERPPLDALGLLFDDPAGLTVNGHVLSLAEYHLALEQSPVASSLLWLLPRHLDSSDREAVRYQTCLCLLAGQAFYRDHGRFPARLEELVPAYLAEIPVDPFDGKPLKYRPDPAQPAIYSVFKNRTDDGGGLVTVDDPGKPPGDPLDLGVRLSIPQRQLVIAPRPVLE